MVLHTNRYPRVADRGMDIEAQMLAIIQELQREPFSPGLAVKEITERFIARHSEDFDWKVTPHWAGKVIRKRLRLKTGKHHGNYFIAASEGPKLAPLCEKDGLSAPKTVSEGEADQDKAALAEGICIST